MNISSRTPEGFPSNCPLCGAATNLEFSDPAGDAPCPNCGHLLWHASEVLPILQRWIADTLGVSPERITADTSIWDFEIESADSIDMVEFVMELEEEFDVTISPEDADSIQTVGDAIRFLERRRLENPATGETIEVPDLDHPGPSVLMRLWRFAQRLLRWIMPNRA